MKEDINIKLNNSEALVLFEFLSNLNEDDAHDSLFEHPAEQRVLWRILNDLESALVEPLQSDYEALLKNARGNVIQS
ncbi:MAG TPA: hypothetical protein VD794_07760 [Flavisolibacter sp.]|nr:hypothetical protein [Flavisolibacter sp.]